jgi:hypothetical protein
MRDLLSRMRPSPAMVVAVVALIAALGGTAFALKIGTKQLKNGAVKTKKLANGAVKTNKLGNGAVTTAKLGNGAVTSDKIAAGAVPRAYAYVNTSQSVVADQSKGMGNTTTSTSGGVVCFAGMPFTPKNAQVTVVSPPSGIAPDAVSVSTQGTADRSECAGSEDTAVLFFVTTTGVADPTPERFFVAFYD